MCCAGGRRVPVRQLWDNRQTVKQEMLERRRLMLDRLGEAEARFATLFDEALA